jgi:hypothetical protein
MVGRRYTLASGTLDASGEAYYTSSTLTAGTHNLTWTYSGDSNFSGSTTSHPHTCSRSPAAPASAPRPALGATVNPIVYGQSASITATVSPASGTVHQPAPSISPSTAPRPSAQRSPAERPSFTVIPVWGRRSCPLRHLHPEQHSIRSLLNVALRKPVADCE